MRGRLLGLALLFTWGCASRGEVDIATLASNSDQVIWEAGQKAAEKRNWESARQHFRRIIDGFPQSNLGPAARLALADSYLKEGGAANYILAASAYREFLTFYPTHDRSAYAQFRVAESFHKQRNPPDRDQTTTGEALAEYRRLLELYPSSPEAETARLRIADCRNSLARAEFLVGLFYQRTRQAYRAAILRFEELLTEYPDYRDLDQVLLHLSESLAAAGRPAEAIPYLARLVAEYPNSPSTPRAQSLLDELRRQPPSPPPGPTPPPPPSPTPVASP